MKFIQNIELEKETKISVLDAVVMIKNHGMMFHSLHQTVSDILNMSQITLMKKKQNIKPT